MESETRKNPRRRLASWLAGLNRAILDSALDCIIRWTGVAESWSSIRRRSGFGFTREQAVGKELAELIIPASLRDGTDRA
jgi:hypothetical protein